MQPVLLILVVLALSPDSSRVKAFFAGDSLALQLVDFLKGAGSSIDYCFYNSSRSDVVQALLNAHHRGVRVRVITDDRRLNDEWVAKLRAAGVPVWSDSGFPGANYYMHNKFVVRDLADQDSTNDMVWTGSYNPNEDELNADFALIIKHPGLARAYLKEFNQMWGSAGNLPVRDSARFHHHKRDVQSGHRFLIDSFPVYVYFAPQDQVVDSIASLVSRSHKEIFFAIFSFTYTGLGGAMIEGWNNGVKVLGVIDKSGANDPASQYPLLKNKGIPVVVDSVPFGTKVLHEKIMVIDRSLVICGSANWSNNSNFNNDENVLFIYNPVLTKRFFPELVLRYREGGGSLMPGIQEGESRKSVFRLWRAGRGFRCESGDLIYDSTGRRQAPGSILTSGLYFYKQSGGSLFRLVVVY